MFLWQRCVSTFSSILPIRLPDVLRESKRITQAVVIVSLILRLLSSVDVQWNQIVKRRFSPTLINALCLLTQLKDIFPL